MDSIVKKLMETKKLKESSGVDAKFIIDHTQGCEKYKVYSEEEAQEKKRELISQGSDEDKIKFSNIKESASDKEYTIEVTRKGKKKEVSGTLQYLIDYFRYTLQTGKSYESEKGNKKINIAPKNIKALVTNLNSAVSNSAKDGNPSTSYSEAPVKEIKEASRYEYPDYYEFALDYRLQMGDAEGSVGEQYPPSMDYLSELQEFAKEDWEEADMHQYLDSNLNVVSTGMDFRRVNGKEKCVIGITAKRPLSDEELEQIQDWISGQMSDGWGEGFEQREIATSTDTEQEWVDDDEDPDGGYYEDADITYYYYGQFWWSNYRLNNPSHRWTIQRIK